MRPRDTKFGRRQLAARRMFFDARGQLTKDARVLLAAFKMQGHFPAKMVQTDANGAVDLNATLAAAARRDVWDYLKRLLNLDDYQESNIREED